MNNIDPIQEELAQAGEASPITPELILLDQKSRITSESEIEDEEFLFRFMGEKCFPRKDLTTITGPAKGGKTFFSSLLMACSTKDAEGTLLHMERISQEPLKVMWYDTEQSKPDIQQRDPNGKFACKDSTSETANNFNREYTIHLPDSEWTWDFRKLFSDALAGCSSKSYEEMETEIMKLANIKQKQYYYKVLAQAEELGVIKKTKDRCGRVVIVMPPQ